VGLVWLAGVRDLQWRVRRFLIAVGGAALVFAITLQLTGFRATFDLETAQLVEDFGAAGYVVRETSEGPFSAAGPLPSSLADELLASGAVGRADPIITGRQPITSPRRVLTYVVGHRPGGLGAPVVASGRAAAAPGEVVVDTATGYGLGETLELGGRTFTVSGTVEGRSLYFGLPLVYLVIDDAQAAAFGGQPLATAILVDVEAPVLPPGYRAVPAAEARRDLSRALESAVTVLTILRLFLWAVAAAIIASVLYVSVLERSRDLAVFKAIGVATPPLAGALALQAVVLSLGAAALACVLAVASRPIFPIPITLPAATMLRLAAVSVVVGLVAALAGLRRSIRIDPATAFRGP
jgi:putative ABC transport system permease protein